MGLMGLLIREASTDDHEALLCQLWGLNRYEQEIAGDRRTDLEGAADSLAEALEVAAQREGIVLIAELNGEAAGHLFMFFQTDDAYVREDLRRYAFISTFFVEPWARGQGVGQALMTRAEEIAAAKQVKRLRLYALSGNTRARRIYEEAGFQLYGVEMMKQISPKSPPGAEEF